MTERQQKLYDKLLKKVNEYCLGQAAEDVIAAIDDLMENYETPKVVPASKTLRAFKRIVKPKTYTLGARMCGKTLMAAEQFDQHLKDIECVETALKENKNLKCKVATTTASCLMLREELNKKNKALEIIKNKRVDTYYLMQTDTLEEYNRCLHDCKWFPNYPLIQEEYKLLKEVLK